MLSGLWTIAKNSFIEIIRQPVYVILLTMGMAMIAFSPAVTMFSMVEDEKLMVDIGLATMVLLGIAISVLSVTQTISREIERQTVGAILSKPVGRGLFVAAKFLGVTMAVAVAGWLLSLTLFITLRVGVPTAANYQADWPAMIAVVTPFLLAVAIGIYSNYFYRWSFSSTAVVFGALLYTVSMGLMLVVTPQWGLDLVPKVYLDRFLPEVATAAALVWLGVWVISSVALAASTRVNVMLNAIICLTVFFVGMISQFLFGQFADTSIPARVAQHIVPNLHVFWVGDALMHEVPLVPLRYLWTAAGYAGGYCAAMLAFAAFLFEKREVV
ncbi:MAG: hypothetical protein R6V05_02665 [Candidatus Brocadiia bacterium]